MQGDGGVGGRWGKGEVLWFLHWGRSFWKEDFPLLPPPLSASLPSFLIAQAASVPSSSPKCLQQAAPLLHTHFPIRVYIPETHSSTSPGILVNRCLPLILSPHWLHLCPLGQEKPIYSSCYLGQPPPPPPLSSPFWIEWDSSWVPWRWHMALRHSQEF